jgi:prefoldin subunit 5
MKDPLKVIALLLIGGLILCGIIMLIALLLPFMILGILIYFEGKKFRSQMGKYQLTVTSGLTLVTIGAASLCLPAIPALHGHYPGYMIIPFSIVIFLTLSIVTLGLWAAIKLYPLQKNIDQMKRERKELTRELSKIEKEMGVKTRVKHQLTDTSTSGLGKRERIEAQLGDLCMSSDQPRVFISLKEKIEKKVKELSVEEIRSRVAALHHPYKPKERGEAVEFCVLELEKLRKENCNLQQKLDECNRETARIGQEKEEKKRTISNLDASIRQKENTLMAKSRRIVLN